MDMACLILSISLEINEKHSRLVVTAVYGRFDGHAAVFFWIKVITAEHGNMDKELLGNSSSVEATKYVKLIHVTSLGCVNLQKLITHFLRQVYQEFKY